MTMLTPGRFLKVMSKTPRLLTTTLQPVTQQQALAATDGMDGWNVVEIVCHLRDFEAIFFQRAVQMVEEDHPTLAPYHHEAMAIEHAYAQQDLREVLAALLETRAAFLAWLKQRSEGDWGRTALHPEFGEVTLLEQVVQVGTHDIDHLEQIIRALETTAHERGVHQAETLTPL